jgi:multicomponent Na+:H+ antiporter subunit F
VNHDLLWTAYIAAGILTSSLIIVVLRLIRGPDLPNRVVALDLMVYHFAALSGIYVITTGHPGFLDVALALALIAFLGTVAFARYLERIRQVNPETL